MRILMVSAYPPARDGIANYAVQSVARLRSEGHEVEVLSPGPSAAHHHLDLVGWRGPLALARRVRSYDKVVLQFHPDFFYPLPASGADRLLVSLALATAFRLAPRLEIVAHEPNYELGRKRGPTGIAVRAMWRGASSVLVHTEAERRSFVEAFGGPGSKVKVTPHGADFVPRTALDRAAARTSLDLPVDQFLFLAIGFIQPHKGFDRAIRGFAGLGLEGCQLHVVGSVRVEEPEYLDHLETLRQLAAATPGVAIHPDYVSDEEFDRWLVAADVVVLPYRHIWSSSVMERAALYNRPVIATRVGGLEGQSRGPTVLVEDDRQLAEAMRRAARQRPPSRSQAPADDWDFDEATVSREAVMAEIRARAAARRPSGAAAGAQPPGEAVFSSAPLRRLRPLVPAAPVSGRPGASGLKRLVRRLTAWQIDPLVTHVNRLQAAVVEAMESLASSKGDRAGPGP